MIAVVLNGCGSSKSVINETETVTETVAETETVDENEEILNNLKSEYGISPVLFAKGDKTGNWRVSTVANSTPPSEYAYEYAKAYMKDGDVHYVVNLSLKTTTKFTLLGTLLDVKTYEYVDKEYIDASVIGRGIELGSNYFDMTTGDEITVDTDESAGMLDSGSLISKVSEIIQDEVGEDEEITSVTFDGTDLKITVQLMDNNTVPIELVALSRISSITDAILSLDDSVYNTWNTVTIDFGDVGQATLDKSMVKNSGYGKYFELPENVLN